MIGKNWEVLGEYKNLLIYKKNNIICFGNKSYSFTGVKSILSAKNRITRYINKLTKNEKKHLKYLKYEI